MINRARVLFAFNEHKTVEAAAHLIDLAGGELDLIVLLKLLYHADRRALIERGLPITGDQMVSMKLGPVLSRVYDTTKGQFAGIRSWPEFISAPPPNDPNKPVRLRKRPPQGQLSRYERAVLDGIYAEHGKRDKWEFIESTHKLPEHRDPGSSRLAIDPTVILRDAGKTTEDISWFEEIVRTSRQAARLRAQ